MFRLEVIDKNILLEITVSSINQIAVIRGKIGGGIIKSPQLIPGDGFAGEICQIEQAHFLPPAQVDPAGTFAVEREITIVLRIGGKLLFRAPASGFDDEPVEPAGGIGLIIDQAAVVLQPLHLRHPALRIGRHLAYELPFGVTNKQLAAGDEGKFFSVRGKIKSADITRHREVLAKRQGVVKRQTDRNLPALLERDIVNE